MHRKRDLGLAFVCALIITAAVQADAAKDSPHAKPELKSAGPLAFGPGGVLFIGDPKSATIFAFETKDTAKNAGGGRANTSINVENINEKIAALLGTRPDQVRIQDLAVNPASGRPYLSVLRGRGPEAQPVILRVDADGGSLSEVAIEKMPCTQAALPNAPEDQLVGRGRRRQNPRESAITDLAFIEGQVIVAGLSNEEFASNLRAIPYPFSEVNRGASIEIFHGNHGRIETQAPIRTFVPISFGGSPQIVAAYTCTPLVRIPLAELRAGAKVHGTTVAELGNRNRPLDIIAYKKDGKDYLLLANEARGVMRITTEGLLTREGITKPVEGGTAGQPYTTIEQWKGVKQLDQLDDAHAIVLIEQDGAAHLRTLPLP